METMHAVGRRRLPPVPRSAPERPAAGQVAVAAPADEADTDQFATQVIDTRQIAAELIEAELMDAELAALTESGAPDAGPEASEAGDTEAVDATDDATDDDTDDDTEVDDELEATAQLPLADLQALMADDDAPSAADVEPGPDVVIDDSPAPVDLEASVPQPRRETAPDRPAESPVESPVDSPAEPPVETPVDESDPAQQFVARLRSSAADFAGAAGAESAVVREAVPPARHRRARCRLVLRYADGEVADVTLLGPVGAPGRPSRHGFDRQILRWLAAGLVQDDAWLVDDPDAPQGVAVDLSAWVAAG